MSAEAIWRAKSNEDLLLAGKQLSEYTALGQAVILAELDRRHIERPTLETRGTDAIRWPRRVFSQIGGVVAFFCFGLLVTSPIQGLRLLGFLIALVLAAPLAAERQDVSRTDVKKTSHPRGEKRTVFCHESVDRQGRYS